MPILNATANPGVASWSADGDGLVLGSGGNARGTAAVDLQTVRAAATQVASGDYSVILGGRNNTASGFGSIAGGANSIATNNYAVAIGWYNYAYGYGAVALQQSTASGAYAICAGYDAQALSDYTICIGANAFANGVNAVAIGFGAFAEQPYSCAISSGSNAVASAKGACSISWNSEASGTYSAALGGKNSLASGAFATALGNATLADRAGSVAFSSQSSALKMQGELVHMSLRTTAGGNDLLQVNGVDGLDILANTITSVQGTVTAWNETDLTSSSWNISALIQRDNANNTTLVGQTGNGTAQAVAAAVPPTGFNNDAGAATLAVLCVADDANERLNIQVTGLAKNIKWSAALLVSRSTT